MGRSASISIVTVLILVAGIAGCGSTRPPSLAPFTPEPVPSEIAAEPRAAAARDAFLGLMDDVDLTFRVDSELDAGVRNGDGVPALALRGRHDATADDYAERVQIGGHVFRSTNDFQLVVVGETVHFDAASLNSDWSEVEAVDDLYRPNAITTLARDDLRYIGETADGLLEYDVVPWIFGDPIGSYGQLGVVDPAVLPATSATSHRTRLFLDQNGVPREVSARWNFESGDASDMASGSLVQRFSAFGLYVAITPPIDGAWLPETSHDVIVGVNAEHEALVEPWFDVVPGPGVPTAELAIRVALPAQPMSLGIEGAMFFLRAHDADGELSLDQIVPFDGGSVQVPAGAQTVTAYYRSCDGSCALLDPDQTFCSQEVDIRPGRRYELIVHPDVLDAECAVTEVA